MRPGKRGKQHGCSDLDFVSGPGKHRRGKECAPVWTASKLSVSQDLIPAIRQRLGQPDAYPTDTLVFRISDQARRILNGKAIGATAASIADHSEADRLMLQLSSSARRRISEATGEAKVDDLNLIVEDVHVVWFDTTEHAVLFPKISFRRADRAPLHSYCLVEAVTSMARLNKLYWRETPPADQAAGPPSPDDARAPCTQPKRTTLGIIMRSLAGPGKTSQASRRVYTNTFLRVDQRMGPDAAEQLALRLSRHYTSEYRVDAGRGEYEVVRDFSNVQHIFCLEGSSAIIWQPHDATIRSEFLDRFLNEWEF